MNLNNIGVIGAGAMGSGIAQVSAVAGYRVVIQDISGAALERARISIEKSLSKLVSKGKMEPGDMEATLDRIQFTTSLEDACKNADLVIEAIFENLEIKHDMFKKLENLCKKDAILGTNTSALSITEIASVSDRGDRIIGVHFMNPVPLMKGVEVIRGQLTSDETMENILAYIKTLGKEAIVAVDYAGFIVSRMVDVIFNEAMRLIQEGNDPEDIDKACTLCLGHPMGPCRLLDLAGADIAMHGLETMERDFGDRYKPHPLLKKRVLAGLLGQKTGRGFYEY
ncbi:MAG TPA: 3-hydroxyacyl-CoA dehydrogenase family protein [Syntrophales bacterium]|nr:3-hydroxyacyl-CoA dehydrogenase family protein [Syntrophales bacterium]